MILPNPFSFTGCAEHAPVDKAAASSLYPDGAAADQSDSGAFSVTAPDEAAASFRQVSAAVECDIPLVELERRGFDAEAFINDIEPLPAFLCGPSQQYLSATDLIPVLHVLAGR